MQRKSPRDMSVMLWHLEPSATVHACIRSPTQPLPKTAAETAPRGAYRQPDGLNPTAMACDAHELKTRLQCAMTTKTSCRALMAPRGPATTPAHNGTAFGICRNSGLLLLLLQQIYIVLQHDVRGLDVQWQHPGHCACRGQSWHTPGSKLYWPTGQMPQIPQALMTCAMHPGHTGQSSHNTLHVLWHTRYKLA